MNGLIELDLVAAAKAQNKKIIDIKEDYKKLEDTFEVKIKEKDQEIYKLMSEIKDKNNKLNEVELSCKEVQNNLFEVNKKIEDFNKLGFWSKGNFKF